MEEKIHSSSNSTSIFRRDKPYLPVLQLHQITWQILNQSLHTNQSVLRASPTLPATRSEHNRNALGGKKSEVITAWCQPPTAKTPGELCSLCPRWTVCTLWEPWVTLAVLCVSSYNPYHCFISVLAGFIALLTSTWASQVRRRKGHSGHSVRGSASCWGPCCFGSEVKHIVVRLQWWPKLIPMASWNQRAGEEIGPQGSSRAHSHLAQGLIFVLILLGFHGFPKACDLGTNTWDFRGHLSQSTPITKF